MAQINHLLYFEDEAVFANLLSRQLGLTAELVHRHRFPDGELKLQLPQHLSGKICILRSLSNPNEKLVELLLTARTARELGAQHISLVSPYLAYMRQDMAFAPGQVVSQKVLGQFLADLFDALITVDPHLHRTNNLHLVMPMAHIRVLSAAPVLGELVAKHHLQPLLIGPDEESTQWVALAAQKHGFEFGVCHKLRHGDLAVDIQLPDIQINGRAIVVLDDMASSGRTLAVTAQQLSAAGAACVDVAVTHALFCGDALNVMAQAGISHVWSTDCISHPSNSVSVSPLISKAVKELMNDLLFNM